MPEAIRQNRANLEIGHPPAASSVFGEWARSEERADSSQNAGGSWDGLDPARLDDGTAPVDTIRRAGQQTGVHPKS